MESFTASAQYDDWEGMVAADDAMDSMRKHLQHEGMINEDNEFLVAVSFWLHEHSSLRLRAFVFHKSPSSRSVTEELAAVKGPIPVREVTVDLTPEEFLCRFTIFHLILTRRVHGLMGRDYFVVEDQSARVEAG
jgi:dsDNA-binding SOS-regulon protein